MKLKINAGTTGRIARVFIQDSTSTAGAGLAGLTYATSNLKWSYARVGDTAATVVTPATAAVGTFTTGGFVALDPTNMPGVYEIGIPNAALAAGATAVHLMLFGATNMVPTLVEIELDAVNYQDAAAFGLSRIDAAISTRSTLVGPSGFSSLVITSGKVAIDATQPATFRDLTSVTTPTLMDCWAAAGAGAAGKESKPNTPGTTTGTLTHLDQSTNCRTFTYDSGSTPSMRS